VTRQCDATEKKSLFGRGGTFSPRSASLGVEIHTRILDGVPARVCPTIGIELLPMSDRDATSGKDMFPILLPCKPTKQNVGLIQKAAVHGKVPDLMKKLSRKGASFVPASWVCPELVCWSQFVIQSRFDFLAVIVCCLQTRDIYASFWAVFFRREMAGD
jgi:hypothetical protein